MKHDPVDGTPAARRDEDRRKVSWPVFLTVVVGVLFIGVAAGFRGERTHPAARAALAVAAQPIGAYHRRRRVVTWAPPPTGCPWGSLARRDTLLDAGGPSRGW